MIYFTSSWDDGSVWDVKLADYLRKHNQEATFFIPLNNIEKRLVITHKQIQDLSDVFEIGAHTINHKYLTRISNEEAEYEIKHSKLELEHITNKPVHGFCFPGGKYRLLHIKYVRQAGFKYARTTNMMKFSNKSLIMNTTLQAYNHSKYTYFIHLLKRGYVLAIILNLGPIVFSRQWDRLLSELLDKKLKHNSPKINTIIHLWGHSWELQDNNSWKQLDRFLDHVNICNIESRTNFEISQLFQS